MTLGQPAVLKLAAFVLTATISIAALPYAGPSVDLPARAHAQHQRTARLVFVSWGSGSGSAVPRSAARWVIYINADSVSLVLRGAWPDSGNTLRLDVYVQGSPWEKVLHGQRLTPRDTAGSWFKHNSISVQRTMAWPALAPGDRLLMTLWPEQIEAAHSSRSQTVGKIRAVLRSASGDSLVAAMSTAFAI